ncbi:MAG TPA: carboxymuconolactone decarboxylase family protein [Mycobacteriales bacterium]|nr:carboxymuconolactone decarboxylase family protein [Mycobacteriales bacterium]
MSAPRIAPGGPKDIGLANWTMIAAGARVARVPGLPHLFTTMARHRSLFRAWLFFAGRLMPRGKLPRRESELVILRTAWRSGCEYELDHHRRLARRAGLSADEVERAVSPSLDGWSPREQALLAAADELHATRNLEDATWEALRRHLSDRDAIEFLLLAGHYAMLASFINTLRIVPDH